jgi:hypothetical protein
MFGDKKKISRGVHRGTIARAPLHPQGADRNRSERLDGSSVQALLA